MRWWLLLVLLVLASPAGAERVDVLFPTPTSPAFFWNARANITKGAKTLAALNTLRRPRELESVVGAARAPPRSTTRTSAPTR